jgi:hypothetical protein
MHTKQSGLRPLLVSVRQARELLGGCANNRIWKLIKDGELEVVGTERKRWVSFASIEAYVERQLAAAATEREAKAKHASSQAEAHHV